ncbi:hypothetical protein [Actinomadura harenae]|uniref:Uncharacterized protein n=1 Tax=Actinomadura harenae TaxID=2483351 RepID=A0A3M2MG39_9ACTN|nr:hypothetical protein [Actinomadura harenae]RMI47605.1 hypothetical protein EBO15_01505 [Actinomadura harenae]
MSRAQVRSGIAAYFGGNTYDSTDRVWTPTPLAAYGLATVRNYVPKRHPDSDFTRGLTVGRGMGTVMIVDLPQQIERRIALGGPANGIKQDVYTVDLLLYHLAKVPHSEDAQADLDALIDAIVNWIHADRTLGGAVVDAGETSAGIVKSLGQPLISGERTEIYASIRFDANTYVNA